MFITDAGVTLVDSKLPGFGPTILERIKTVTNEPITRIINTHTHGDHTGSNSFFGASVESIVHENARASMAKMPEFSAANARFLPRRTYTYTLTLGAGKDQIDLYHFGRGHTNGDTFVVFTALRNDARRRHVRVEGAPVRGLRPSCDEGWEDCRSGGR
jgi:glyoxylase-like metal-dependent hydrolase (beta-lactamase superfamily II)